MSESLELLRNDVKMKLSKGALDGEAGIVKMSYFQAYGPTTWLRGIRADLHRHHLVESKRPEGGRRMMQGVSLLEFHRWVARKVQSADQNNFTPPEDVTGWGFLNNAMTTSALYGALKEWAKVE